MGRIAEQFAEAAAYQASCVKYYADHYAEVNALEAAFKDAISVRINSWSMDISIAGSMGDLLGAMTLLEERGYKTEKELPEATQQYITVTYHHENPKCPTVYLYWTNKFCERVEVGTETKPVYEYRCTGGVDNG